MNAPDMIDYALGQIEGPAREMAEREVAADPELAATLDRLRPALDRLLDDGEAYDPPAGLARRTVALAIEPRPRRRTILDFAPTTVPFRWADVAVAASILLASMLTLLPAFHRSRERMEEAGCGFNLQQLGLSLSQYGIRHGIYPYAPYTAPEAPSHVAGSFAAALHEDGLLHDLSTLDCPSNGRAPEGKRLPHSEALRQIRNQSPDDYCRMLRWDYAYNVGYRHPSGRPGPVPASLSSRVPLLADEPPHRDGLVLEGNSPNHGLRGQNVLFTDGHVGWFNTRQIDPLDPDLFLNNAHEPAPGLRPEDAALIPSFFSFPSR